MFFNSCYRNTCLSLKLRSCLKWQLWLRFKVSFMKRRKKGRLRASFSEPNIILKECLKNSATRSNTYCWSAWIGFHSCASTYGFMALLKISFRSHENGLKKKRAHFLHYNDFDWCTIFYVKKLTQWKIHLYYLFYILCAYCVIWLMSYVCIVSTADFEWFLSTFPKFRGRHYLGNEPIMDKLRK